ncbi:ABC transporter substrate-binding protein [Limimaricola variabilis]|uniref:ABC transporter substrate-binding protein n=1 Tax=Limimaricola variabilis TaxID=1492771 RepID=UPI002AC9B736|nr:ABC transporter substrate-binding protein [Limimaricola variabilis]WPY93133.1 ABC transporter substrate-binding protein [Limimaricola variabilis]
MNLPVIALGFTPLVDAAPVIVAREMGFARAEGIDIALHRAPSWSASRDMLAFGAVDAAHMLSAVPVATALGLGGAGAPIHALSVLSLNGNVIGVSRDLAARMRARGHGFGFDDAGAAALALRDAAGAGLRIGVPFPFSMHAELIRHWLDTAAPGAEVQIRSVPPPLMAEAIGAGEIDAFCVGEPWGSIAVETGTGELLLPGAAIWDAAPEKVLAVRAGEAGDPRFEPLLRAVWRAGRWLAQPGSRTAAAELLARPEYLDMPAELVDRALSGRLTVSSRGEVRRVDRLVSFDPAEAGYPWGAQAAWIGRHLAARAGRDPEAAARSVTAVFRGDLYRRALAATGASLPLGDSDPQAPGLRPERFFDGRIFDSSPAR